jgi:hypothetical protein
MLFFINLGCTFVTASNVNKIYNYESDVEDCLVSFISSLLAYIDLTYICNK